MADADDTERSENQGNENDDDGLSRKKFIDGDNVKSVHGSREDEGEDVPRREKIMRTVALFAVFFAGIGIPLFGVGPCLLDLQLLTKSTTQQISFVFTARSIGALIGGCLEGWLIDRKNVWLTIGVTTVSSNLMYLLAPQFGHLGSLIALMGLHGLGYGVFSTCINITLTRIWGKDQGPWMQALHMVGVFGGVISPLLAKPFLSDSVPHVASIDEEAMDYNHTHGNITSGALVEAASSVKNFFILSGSIGMLSSLGCWIVFCSGNKQVIMPRKKKKPEVAKESDMKVSYLKILILGLTFVFYMLLSVYGRGYPNYTMAFTVEYLGWNKLDGALLTSLYLGVYVLGRVAGIFLIVHLYPQTVIISDLVISVSATIPVILVVHRHVSVFWICTLMYGLGNATIYASGFPWLAQYFKMSGNVGSVPQIGGFVGDILGPPLVGYLFEYVTPMGFIYVSTGGGLLSLVIFLTMQILARRYTKENIERDILELKVSDQPMDKNVEHTSM